MPGGIRLSSIECLEFIESKGPGSNCFLLSANNPSLVPLIRKTKLNVGDTVAIEFWKQDAAIDLLTSDQLKSLGIISVECSAIEEYVNGLLPVSWYL